jgi:protein SCO1/2
MVLRYYAFLALFLFDCEQNFEFIMYFMRTSLFRLFFFLLCYAFLANSLCSNALSLENPAEIPDQTSPNEHLGDTVPLSLEFKTSDGNNISLESLIIKDRPLIIIPVYFSCPRLCGMILSGFTKLLNNLELTIGSDFSIAAVSFNEAETEKDSAKAKKKYLSQLVNQVGAENAWHFLTGTEENISLLMKSIGFNYQKDGNEFSHTALFVVVTPQGVISRYVYGVEYTVRDVKFSLIEASRGKIGQTFDKILLYCFRYDHIQGQYTIAIFNIIRIFSILILILLFGFLYKLRKNEKTKQQTS